MPQPAWPPEMPSLSEAIGAESRPTGRHLLARDRRLSPGDLLTHTMLDAPPDQLAGRSVMLWTREQLTAAAAMIELDGRARRLLVCPPDIAEAHIPVLMRIAEIDVVVTDRPPSECAPLGTTATARCLTSPHPTPPRGAATNATEWVLATSGTTGAPKLVVHSLAALTGVIRTQPPPADGTVWATFYDIRRYGGLQIFLRAILGSTALVLSDEHESPSDHISRLAAAGATHITGTPSHWRRALMSPDVARLTPRYVRLSGEIADQPTLDMLRAAFPTARIGHAYASTEAGVAFDVEDGQAGFPESLLGNRGGVEMKVEDGTLRIRSDRTASRYLGPDAPALHDAGGFIDTGDFVTLVDGRYAFVGRQGGIINVGGQKVHPEEIEAVINAHPAVHMSLARAQRNPLTGSIVVADVVPAAAVPDAARHGLTEDIAEHCRSRLARHKVPVIIRFVPSLPITAGGKLRRTHA